MAKWLIVKRIPVYGVSFTSIGLQKHILAPSEWSWSWLHSLINTREEDEQLLKNTDHSDRDYMNLVENYTRDGNLSAENDLLQSVQDSKNIYLPVSVLKNLLVAAACELNDTKLSCRAFRELLVLVGTTPLSSDCYLNFARAFINTILAFSESRQIDMVVKILEEMKEWECKPHRR